MLAHSRLPRRPQSGTLIKYQTGRLRPKDRGQSQHKIGMNLDDCNGETAMRRCSGHCWTGDGGVRSHEGFSRSFLALLASSIPLRRICRATCGSDRKRCGHAVRAVYRSRLTHAVLTPSARFAGEQAKRVDQTQCWAGSHAASWAASAPRSLFGTLRRLCLFSAHSPH
jgi:hypothetical protein